MSMNTRKLFPVTNQSTSGCPYVCDSTCPYGCYPYVDLDYYIPPPSFPPPPPLLPPPRSSSKHLQNISPYIIISVALFASLFLLLSYYLIIVKNCSNWNRRRSTAPDQGSDEEFIDENRAPVIDHHIWYINTVGLQPSLINLIGEFKYKTGDGLVEGTDCSVCLSEFQDDESLRLLPKCNHAFHIHCIDTWLRSHTNCPLCRAPIFSNTVNAPVVSIEPNLSTNSSPNEERQLEIDAQRGRDRDGDGEVNNDNEVRDSEIRENGTGVSGDQDGFLVIERSRSSKKEEDGEVHAMRRSVSVDSSIAASIGLDMVMLSRMSGGEKGCVETAKTEVMDSASMALSLHKEPVLMKKSFSYGGRSFFSRHHSSSSSVLPL